MYIIATVNHIIVTAISPVYRPPVFSSTWEGKAWQTSQGHGAEAFLGRGAICMNMYEKKTETIDTNIVV